MTRAALAVVLAAVTISRTDHAASALVVTLAPASALLQSGATRHRVIFDTDFALPPQDDGLALALALNSPELDIAGITTVAGNYNVQRANADALRMLEIAHREEIGVYGGAARPLVHEKDAYAMSHYGRWWSDEAPPMPPGGFARKRLGQQKAADFLWSTVTSHPGQIEILALGPLTNIALAIHTHSPEGFRPDFAKSVKRLVIMGGAIDSLPDGAGNITPNAEFNFWVDPEAARDVLRSGIPIELSPLNVSRKTALTKASFDKLVAHETPITILIRTQMAPFFEQPNYSVHMYDELAVASLIDRSLVKTKKLIVDVDTTQDSNYGRSVGATTRWAGAEGASRLDVQYDVDVSRFMQLFVDRVTK